MTVKITISDVSQKLFSLSSALIIGENSCPQCASNIGYKNSCPQCASNIGYKNSSPQCASNIG